MSRCLENHLTFRSLHESGSVSLREYRCHAGRGGPAAEEYSGTNHIVLMRHGAFCKHFGRRSMTADVNQAVFFSQGSTYRVSHPADCGDLGTVFSLAPHVLYDIVRELDPAIEDRPELPFRFVTGPCTARVFRRHRELLEGLQAASCAPVDPLWADVTALELIAAVLEAAFARHAPTRTRRRDGTDAAHVDHVEAAKSYLASQIGERVNLEQLARAVHASPFHLARVFQQRTGVPVHRYLTELRLRTALERLAAGANDLTLLALELGFSSHSHFTSAFRGEFGCTPSRARQCSNPREVRELSKNLKV